MNQEKVAQLPTNHDGLSIIDECMSHQTMASQDEF